MSVPKSFKKQIEQRRISRRQFLVEAGQAMLYLPPLISLMPSQLAAQVLDNKTRRTVIYTGSLGIDQQNLYPSLPAGMTQVSNQESMFYKRLSDFTGPISRMIDLEFASLYNKMNIIQGLSLCGGRYNGHNKSILSGTHTGGREPVFGKSIDVIMEQSANVYASATNVSHKAIRLASDNHIKGFSFDRVNGNRVVSGAMMGDLNLFNTLFANLVDSEAGSAPTGLTQGQKNEKLVVDKVFNDLKSLERNPRLSSEDAQLLDRYITGIHEVQQRIVANQSGEFQCSKPSMDFQANITGNPHKFPFEQRWGIENSGLMFDNYMELIKLAFVCDLTRVVFIGNSIWDDRPISTSSEGGLHHECASSAIQADRQNWGLKKMMKLAQGLDSVQDPHGDGTILDNSLLFFTNELGAWRTSHNVFNIPAVTFGGGGGSFKTGYFLDCRQKPLQSFKDYYPGRPYKQLLQSIMRSAGVTQAEYSQFGDGNGFGEFKEGISQNNAQSPNMFSAYKNEHNNPLPFLST